MEDLYNILEIKPNSSKYKIARSYKKGIAGLLNSSQTAFDEETFIKINQAYFVLGNEEGRKFYDILYKCLIKNTQQLNDSIIAKYTDVVEYLAEDGVKKAKLWLENLKSLEDSDLTRSLFFLFLIKGLLKSYGASLALSGAGGIIFILVSIYNLIKTIMHFRPEYFAVSIFLSLLGTTILVFRYRDYVVLKVEKETGLLANI